MSRRHLSPAIAAVACGAFLVLGGCSTSPFQHLGDSTSGEIVQGDTILFKGEQAIFAAQVQYNIGPGAPQSIRWGVSDTAKLAVLVSADLSALVTARDTGQAKLYAVINEQYYDSVAITIVGRAEIRWRRSLTASPALYSAVDDSGQVYTAIGGNQVTVVSSSDGGVVRTSALCVGTLGPSVSDGGVTATAQDCVQRIPRGIGAGWMQAFGQAQSGVALTADDASLVVSVEGGVPGTIVLSRIGATGAIAWRDTLTTGAQPTGAGLAIGSDGSIYAPWRTATDSSRLTRFASGGAPSWTLELPGPTRLASPAVVGTRVVVTYDGGVLVALTTGGTVAWSRAFTDAGPGFSATTAASSPVVDGSGNIYIQTPDGLLSYNNGGTVRWVADTLGGGDATLGVGAPTLLGDNTLVVPCGGDLCGVAATTGARVWRVALGGAIGGVSVGPDGTIIAVRRTAGGGELVGLWNRSGLNVSGWPTEGADAARSRRGH
jgi:hypothetical protein